jgi:hypothetical protein
MSRSQSSTQQSLRAGSMLQAVAVGAGAVAIFAAAFLAGFRGDRLAAR